MFAHATAIRVVVPLCHAVLAAAGVGTLALAGVSVVEGNSKVRAVVAASCVLGETVDDGGGSLVVLVVDGDRDIVATALSFEINGADGWPR